MAKKEPKPKALKRWDRRPWPRTGDKDISVLYASVGRFLSQWERYEGTLSLVFSAFVANTESQAARRAYVAVRTFEGRADMLRAASAAYFEEHPNPELQEDFKRALGDATSFAARRNDVAHGVVDYYLPESFEGGDLDLELFSFYPSYASFKERSLSNVPTYCYSSVELDYFYGEFLRLVVDSSRIAGHLLKLRKQPSPRRHYEPGLP